jgi:hypothetical protein
MIIYSGLPRSGTNLLKNILYQNDKILIMIKPEELKDKNFKIFLGMPMYGGMLTENTMHGLLQLQQWSMAQRCRNANAIHG